MANRTLGTSLTSGFDSTVPAQPTIDGETLIAVKPSYSTEAMIMIRAADFDVVLHYRLSAEEIAQVGKAKSFRWPSGPY